jgi:hypothetical protein
VRKIDFIEQLLAQKNDATLKQLGQGFQKKDPNQSQYLLLRDRPTTL